MVCPRPTNISRKLTHQGFFAPPKGPIEKQINVIIGRLASKGDSSSTRKAYARSTVEKRPKRDSDPEITFNSGNEKYPNHDNALVISMRIANARVKRIMIDAGSSTDIYTSMLFRNWN
ncbi:hypothetical protein BHM03_00044673 [Ensete ventricosum]|nr:hypothetical protein BHM03_00044673 [Ensete ventricosum]